jgi:lysophospholipase L1-like esterase
MRDDAKGVSVAMRDREHTINKPEGVFRILGLGDSYLWGQGVKREEICLTKLEPLLQDAVPGKQIETINTGVSALNTSAELAVLRGAGLSYDPDLVIVHYALNDVELDVFRPGRKIEFYVDYTNIHTSADWLSSLSCRYVDECIASFNEESPG